MEYAYALARGLGIVEEYDNAKGCIANTSVLLQRY
jgi:hypothetical protein